MADHLIGLETIDAVLSAETPIAGSMRAETVIGGSIASSSAIDGQVEQRQNVNGDISTADKLDLSIEPRATLNAELTLPETRQGGTNDYEELINKPQINKVTLIKNKSFEDLGLLSLTNRELEQLLS